MAPLRNPEVSGTQLYLTAEEAAAALGVAVASLYAYVGRKGIRSQGVPGTRARLYWREDIDRIAARQGPDRVVTADSILVPETKITLLTDTGPYYRGTSAVALSETATLEETAALLWEHDLEALFPPTPPETPPGFAEAWNALSRLAPVDRALALFPLLEAASPRSYDRTPLGFARTGAALLRWFAALVAEVDGPTADPIHLVLSRAFSKEESDADIIRRLLVLFADHELSPTTYAVRATANTGSTPYQAVMAGLVASKGQRIIEGRAPSIRRFLQEVMSDADPGHPVIERYQAGESVPGFSHSLYRGGDMRARSLMPILEDRFGSRDEFRRLARAIHVAHDAAGVEPDLALLAFFIERGLERRSAFSSIQVVARSVGWIAHAREQMDSMPLVRPRAAYTGVLPRHPSGKMDDFRTD